MNDSYLTTLLERSRQRRKMPPPAVCRGLREQAEVSQQELAQVIGVSRESISRWETGQRRPRGLRLASYLAALGRLVDEVGS